MSQKNVELVRLAYEESYAQRSVESLRDRFAPEFRFHMRPEFPGSKSSYSPEELPQMWADLDETFTEFRLVPQDFTEVGEYVLVTIRQSARMRGSDARVVSTIYHLWHVRDGKGLEAWAHSTREGALEAAGLSE